MTEDEAALDRWFLEYAKPHIMNALCEQLRGVEIDPAEPVHLFLYEGDTGLELPMFVIEQVMKDEEF